MNQDFVAEARTGWRSLLGAAIGIGLGVGCYTPISSLFFRALETRFGWSSAAAVTALVAMPLTGLTLPFIGMALDRFGVKTVAAVSVVLLSASAFGLSLMNGSLVSFYILFLALNVLGAGSGPITYTRSVVAAFRHSTGFALSLALLGLAASSTVLPLWLGPLLAVGRWRSGYRLMAVVSLAGGLIACLMLDSNKRLGASTAQHSGVDLGVALRSRTFWLLAFAIFFISMGTLGLLSQLQSVLVEHRLSLILAARMIAVLAISVTLSRLVIGRALDVASPHVVAAVVMVLSGFGDCLLLIRGRHLSVLTAAILLIGFSGGAENDILAFFCIRAFGFRRYGSIFGALSLFFYTGIAAGGIAYGRFHDVTGSYQRAVLMSAVLLYAAAALFLSMRYKDRKLLGRASPLAASPQRDWLDDTAAL